MELARTVGTLNLLGDENRLRLCALLRERELTVSDLVRVTGISQSRVSTHLARLREGGFVRDRRGGQNARPDGRRARATMDGTVTVIGGGPAGLMAAEVLAAAGCAVEVHDAMPSPGRKFLLAGIGGLNLTHAEPADAFLARYGERRAVLEPLLAAFGADALRAWAHGLGVETFVGSSGRVFPTDM